MQVCWVEYVLHATLKRFIIQLQMQLMVQLTLAEVVRLKEHQQRAAVLWGAVLINTTLTAGRVLAAVLCPIAEREVYVGRQWHRFACDVHKGLTQHKVAFIVLVLCSHYVSLIFPFASRRMVPDDVVRMRGVTTAMVSCL